MSKMWRNSSNSNQQLESEAVRVSSADWTVGERATGARWWSKLRRTSLLLASATLMATAVQAAGAVDKNTAAGGEEVGEIVVSIKPLHALVQSVLGDTREARLLVDGYASPHGYALKPSQVGAINRAAAVFFIDPAFERFLHRALEAAPKGVRSYPLVKSVEQLELLKVREGGAWEGHHHHHDEGAHEDEHGHEDGHHAKTDHKEAEHGHEKARHKGEHHAHEDEHHGHDDGEHGEHASHALEYDMHVWLSPVNAQHILRTVAKELGGIYPQYQAQFTRNAEAEIQRIQQLDGKLQKQLTAAQNKPYIVFHDAYQYFEQHYGLHAVGSITLEPSESPSVQRIREIREKIKKQKVLCVFSEPQFSDKLLRTVITDDAVRTAQLDPLGAEVKSGAAAYSAILQNLADATAQCLQ